MTVGPVQLLVLGFDKPEFHGELLAEFERLRDSDVVRIIDAVAVYKDAQGSVSTIEMSQLNRDEKAEFGAKVGALIGLGAAGEEGLEVGAELGAERGAAGNILPEEEIVDVLAEIPNETAAAILLLEHRWAIPAREVLHRLGGYPVLNIFVSPLDLYEVGLATREDIDSDAALADRAGAKGTGAALATA